MPTGDDRVQLIRVWYHENEALKRGVSVIEILKKHLLFSSFVFLSHISKMNLRFRRTASPAAKKREAQNRDGSDFPNLYSHGQMCVDKCYRR